MNFYIETYGCQMNKADSLSLTQDLIRNGFNEVFDYKLANIVIINTCSVRKSAEDRIWGRLGFYKSIKKKLNLIVLVMGCMSQRIGEELISSSSSSCDIVVGTYYKDKIPEILKDYKYGEKKLYIEEKKFDFSFSSPDKDNNLKAYVTISRGCNNFCSYCIVPYLRGPEISRDSKSIIEDINNLVKKGVVQITLLGQNVNSYGKDIGDITFPQLLKKICSETGIQWIKYLSSHPKDFNDQLIEIIATEDKISKWVHLAVQSGSNNILRKMNRNYSIESYLEKINKLKKLVPKINLTTDIIVGFCNETEQDFEDTKELLKIVEFDDAYMYKYNPIENTYAYKNYQDDVEEEIKLKRLQEIIDLQKRITIKKKKERLGNSYSVIPERWSKKNDSEILGLSKEDLTIIFKGDSRCFGKINKVYVDSLIGNTLSGKLI